jgi:cell division protein FtsW (lipid II flippase)
MTDEREFRLLIGAGTFLFLYAAILTLAPAVREQSWSVAYRLSHWIGYAVWMLLAFSAHRIVSRYLPDRDPFLLPLSLLLSGWGILTIWRLDSGFGLRQALWLGVSVIGFSATVFYLRDLHLLRHYKYVLLSGGLAVTVLTLFLGTNPSGFGPRLWLGCCGVYLQPSEPLKLLLVIYLAAYLADNPPIRLRVFPLLLPTILATGLGIILLLVQRDLGTASIFILLYMVILFLATGRGRVLIATAAGIMLAGIVGYFFVDIVHTRLDVWLNPWNDPTGHSYQIIQSLLAVANGGALGRGPGLGSPGLVPVAHSDFIFSAIAEETGLVGTIGMLLIYSLILSRGLSAALRGTTRFGRMLAGGLTTYLGIQALLIIGGNIRLLPLTGETLPFVAYGGSSLLTAFVALALLVIISGQNDIEPAPLYSPRPYYAFAILFGIGLVAAALTNTWWAIVRAPELLARTDNPRRSIADRYVRRGAILDRNGQPINETAGASGSYLRVYLYPDLAPLVGYTHPIYGQSGMEASLDDYLRGLQGNPTSLVWWDQLVYGMPPPGLDVRLSLDLELQKKADQLLGDFNGAAVVLDARSGEILVNASHPSFDPNKLDKIGQTLLGDPNSPLVNRATQVAYPLGEALTPFIKTLGSANQITNQRLLTLYDNLGFFTAPALRIPVAATTQPGDLTNLRVSPLQMAIATGTLSNGGMRPSPRIALAVKIPQQGWVVLPALSQASRVIQPNIANQTIINYALQKQSFWQWTGQAASKNGTYSWFIAGTLPDWQGTPLAVVVLIEGNYPITAEQVGRLLIKSAIKP